MPINILFAAKENRWPLYEQPLRDAFAAQGLDVHLALNIPPADVDYIVYAPNSDLKDFAPYTRAKAVLNLWAGVEGIVGNKTLKIPLCRMVDPALTQGMIDWVTGHVLRHHLGMDAHITAKPGTWNPEPAPVSWDRKITVLGLGELGAACAQSLSRLGFDTHGWSRRAKSVDGITTHSGQEGLKSALDQSDGVVLLLPSTPDTENTINAETLSWLQPGAFLLNPGRGPLIEDDALIAALNSGQLSHATLDTFRVEPLPLDHPFWHHSQITVTPHIAAETRPKWSSITVAENVKRGEAGEPFLHVVDRAAGY